jgi:hypothetical protein
VKKIFLIYIISTYYLVLEAKKYCYPNDNGILLSKTSTKIKLQALTDHTINVILIELLIILK